MALLEVSCFGPESAILAGQTGADRIELCDNQSEGGTTPPLEWISQVKSAVTTPVFVMIRPRGGNFLYTDDEFAHMQAAVDELKGTVEGFVFGVLDAERKVDVARTACLVEKARPLPCTFHKAFDETPEPLQALEDVVAAGCQTILTSGGAPDALSGVQTLRKLVASASGRIEVLVGGGVRLHNLAEIRAMSGATAFHSSALVGGKRLPDVEGIHRMKQMLLEASR